MKPESELPGLAESTVVSLKPAPGREAPVVWVKALAVHSEWPAQPDTLLREIRLRRGLNILWAQPAEAGTSNRTSGHATGKTTFCRLLRYLLDDADSGTKDFRQRFQKNFPRGGWVLGEVIVAGQQWLVGRPLSPGFQRFALKDGSLADAKGEKSLRGGYEDYQAALDAAAFKNVTLRNLSATNRQLTWDCLLEWLARDQEARFSGLLEWRHPDSDYESPSLVAADKENLVRVMLGLVEGPEQVLLREHAGKAAEHSRLVDKRPKVEFLVERHRATLEMLLGQSVPVPKEPLDFEALRQTVADKSKAWRADAEQSKKAVRNESEEQRLQNVLTNCQAQLLAATVSLEDENRQLSKLQGTLYTTQKSTQDQEQLDEFRAGLKPFKGFCSVPLEEALQEPVCPRAAARPADAELDRLMKAAQTEAQRQEILVRRQRQECSRLATLVQTKTTARDNANSALRKFRDENEKKLIEASKPALRAGELEAAFKNYGATRVELEELEKTLVNLDRDKRDLDARLKLMSEAHLQRISQFTRIYDHFAKLLMGDDVTAKVDFAGKAIEPSLDCDGPRDSTALKLAKWLAFDLGSMALSVTGAGHHPRFLLHDSPREADITEAIYHELFRAATALENATSGEPAFQYIVTTTQSPPDDVRQTPWLLDPVLSGSEAKTRFLGVNL
jgi:hypothetical protein